MTRIAIVGAGPAGYEAALVAVQLGAQVTLVDRDGVGGMCVLADCVPSKTFIATSDAMTTLSHADRVGVHTEGTVTARIDEVHARVKALALAQSADIKERLVREGVRIENGAARLLGGGRVQVGSAVLAADVILDRIAAGVSVPPGFESASESSILETIYLMTIPGMAESIREGMNTSLDDCSDEIDWLPADGQPNTH